MATQTPISMQLYGRLTKYLNYLGERQKAGPLNVSATLIAEALGLNEVRAEDRRRL